MPLRVCQHAITKPSAARQNANQQDNLVGTPLFNACPSLRRAAENAHGKRKKPV